MHPYIPHRYLRSVAEDDIECPDSALAKPVGAILRQAFTGPPAHNARIYAPMGHTHICIVSHR